MTTSTRDASLEITATGRVCGWCRGGIPTTTRRDAIYCSKRCRQAAHRFGRGCVARARSIAPLRFAYADPPYPGKAFYYRGRPDFAGEVDHGELLSRLAGYDGWALSTSSRALPQIAALAVAQGLEVRVGAWFRGARPRSSSYGPLASWEPVVFAGGRAELSPRPPLDSLQYVSRPRKTDPQRVIGAKPATFIWWLFDLLGALPGDELVDLYPGSGGVGRAWTLYQSRSAAADASRGDRAATLERAA